MELKDINIALVGDLETNGYPILKEALAGTDVKHVFLYRENVYVRMIAYYGDLATSGYIFPVFDGGTDTAWILDENEDNAPDKVAISSDDVDSSVSKIIYVHREFLLNNSGYLFYTSGGKNNFTEGASIYVVDSDFNVLATYTVSDENFSTANGVEASLTTYLVASVTALNNPSVVDPNIDDVAFYDVTGLNTDGSGATSWKMNENHTNTGLQFEVPISWVP